MSAAFMRTTGARGLPHALKMVGEISLSDQLLISRITSCLALPDSGRTYHKHDAEHDTM